MGDDIGRVKPRWWVGKGDGVQRKQAEQLGFEPVWARGRRAGGASVARGEGGKRGKGVESFCRRCRFLDFDRCLSGPGYSYMVWKWQETDSTAYARK